MTTPLDEEIAAHLQRIGRATQVPETDPAREAALLAAFDAARARAAGTRARVCSASAMLAAAAAVLIAVGILPMRSERHGLLSGGAPSHTAEASRGRDVQSASIGEFVIVPGALTLPPLESGTVVRTDLPMAILPSLGLTPPSASSTGLVTADLIVGQDGVTRAVRLVN